MTVGTWVILIVIIVAITGFMLQGRKKKWYKIYLANNDVIVAYRVMTDWWFKDSSGIMGFRLVDGRILKVSKCPVWLESINND